MPFKRTQYIDEISYKLSVLKMELMDHNRAGLYDSNLMAENFFCGFLNILYGWELKNANDRKRNCPGIDLIDEENLVVVQVSGTADANKIQDSIDKFLEYEKPEEEYQFYMLVITEKQKEYKRKFVTERAVKLKDGTSSLVSIAFDKTTDIWDSSDLIAQLKKRQTTIRQLEDLYTYLEQELGRIDRERAAAGSAGNRIRLQDEESDKTPYLFISYSHKDREQVYPILHQLRQVGMNFWYDDDLEHGDDYLEKLQDAIDASAGVLAFLSKNVNTSNWCAKEIHYAIEKRGLGIYPVYLEETTLKHGLGLQIGSIQSVFLYENDDIQVLESRLMRGVPEVFITKSDKEKSIINRSVFFDKEVQEIEPISSKKGKDRKVPETQTDVGNEIVIRGSSETDTSEIDEKSDKAGKDNSKEVSAAKRNHGQEKVEENKSQEELVVFLKFYQESNGAKFEDVLNDYLKIKGNEANERIVEEPNTEHMRTHPERAYTYGTNEAVVEQEPDLQLKIGDTYEFGSYTQDADGTVRPILWRVLDVDEQEHKALLLADKILDARPYFYKYEETNWEKSGMRDGSGKSLGIRGWLNREFMDQAFPEEKDRKRICRTRVVPDENQNYPDMDQGNATEDCIFLLSGKEVIRYFGGRDVRCKRGEYWIELNNDASMIDGTGYAKQNALYVWDENGMSPWWLRSVGVSASCAMFVRGDGAVRAGGGFVDGDNVGVRPAFWINLKS